MSGGRRQIRLLAYSDAVEIGGAEQSLGTLLSALGAHVDVTVVGVDQDVAEAIAARRPGTRLELVPAIASKRDVRAIRAHLAVVRRLRPDVFHANLRWLWTGQMAIASGLATRGVAVVAVEHAAPVPSPHRLQRLLKRGMCMGLDAHVAVGDRSARLIERYVGLRTGSVRTIHNGVAVESVQGPVERHTDGPVIGTVGRVTPEKGFAGLLHVLREIPAASVVVVGDGPDRGALERRAAELGVADRLLVTGWVDEPIRWLRGFDVFVLPSHLEAFPLTIVEAMLAGIPVVATDVGSVSEAVVDGDTGALVEPGDDDALARRIGELLLDPLERERLAARARAVALESFTARRMAERFESLYEEVVG